MSFSESWIELEREILQFQVCMNEHNFLLFLFIVVCFDCEPSYEDTMLALKNISDFCSTCTFYVLLKETKIKATLDTATLFFTYKGSENTLQSEKWSLPEHFDEIVEWSTFMMLQEVW